MLKVSAGRMEQTLPLRRSVRLVTSDVRPVRLRATRLTSHPHMKHSLHAAVQARGPVSFLPAGPASIGCTHQRNWISAAAQEAAKKNTRNLQCQAPHVAQKPSGRQATRSVDPVQVLALLWRLLRRMVSYLSYSQKAIKTTDESSLQSRTLFQRDQQLNLV